MLQLQTSLPWQLKFSLLLLVPAFGTSISISAVPMLSNNFDCSFTDFLIDWRNVVS